MEYDLLFTFINKKDWKPFTESGFFTPNSLDDIGYIKCFEGKYAELIANSNHSDSSQLLLLVIDPLRINEPIKKISEDKLEFYTIQGKFSIDAIIDRITLKKSNSGHFNIRIKHFD